MLGSCSCSLNLLKTDQRVAHVLQYASSESLDSSTQYLVQGYQNLDFLTSDQREIQISQSSSAATDMCSLPNEILYLVAAHLDYSEIGRFCLVTLDSEELANLFCSRHCI